MVVNQNVSTSLLDGLESMVIDSEVNRLIEKRGKEREEVKEDEKRFLIDVYLKCEAKKVRPASIRDILEGFEDRMTPRKIINDPDFYMHYKRAWYLLDKWSRKRWYEWGVNMELGWLTPEGINKVKEIMNSQAE
jgi:hypothetical protein